MQAVLKAQINKTDRNDARGIAQMMRVGLYRLVHVKTLRSQKLRMLLTHRKLLQSKAIAIENDLRGTLGNFGLKVGMVGTVKFEARIKELVGRLIELGEYTTALAPARASAERPFSKPLAANPTAQTYRSPLTTTCHGTRTDWSSASAASTASDRRKAADQNSVRVEIDSDQLREP